MDHSNGILGRPFNPDAFNICPSCLALFVLEYCRTDAHDVVTEVYWYRCRKCGYELTVAKELPKDAI